MNHTSLFGPSAALQQVQLDGKLLQESTPRTHNVNVAMNTTGVPAVSLVMAGKQDSMCSAAEKSYCFSCHALNSKWSFAHSEAEAKR